MKLDADFLWPVAFAAIICTAIVKCSDGPSQDTINAVAQSCEKQRQVARFESAPSGTKVFCEAAPSASQPK